MNFIQKLKQLMQMSSQGSRPQGQFESLPMNMSPEQMAAKGNQNMSRGYDSYGDSVQAGLPISPLQVLINRMRSMKK